MTSICTEFRDTSTYVFDWFLNKKNVKEESFTDWFLYNLSLRIPTFKYVEFSRKKESHISGADFDFWIITKRRNLSLRVQAKKLKLKGNHYDALTYPKNTKAQINLLLSSSKFPLRPFYLFYNNGTGTSKCPFHNSGIFLTDAKIINSKFLSGSKIKINRNDLLALSTPLECLFCCPISKEDDNELEGIKTFVDNYFPTKSNNTGFSEDLPRYILDILDSDLTDEKWQERYQSELERNVKYIAVLDLRYQ